MPFPRKPSWSAAGTRVLALGVLGITALGAGCGTVVTSSSDGRIGTAKSGLTGPGFVPDCYESGLLCVELNDGSHPDVGHNEATAMFFSNAGNSGNSMKWKLQLPSSPATPTQDGATTSNFELFVTQWLGLVMCDPNSAPYGACTPDSDANVVSTAGSSFMELQFNPPGTSFPSNQWSILMAIFSDENVSTFQHDHCEEPGISQFLTLDGTPAASPGSPPTNPLLLNDGDSIVVTMADTASGLRIDVQDLTSGSSGFMVASGANGFVHNAVGKNTTNDSGDCATVPFDFHPLWQTAAPSHILTWSDLQVNVSFSMEIGHDDLCSDSTCTTQPAYDTVANDGSCQTDHGIGFCFGDDDAELGTSFRPDWADGSSSHPTSYVISSFNDQGVGPMTTPVADPTNYDEGFGTVEFKTTQPTQQIVLDAGTTSPAFYPFYTEDTACHFRFGNNIPGVSANDFALPAGADGRTQYGSPGTTLNAPTAGQRIANPCEPGVRETTLRYTGETAQDFDDVAVLSATLSDVDNNPIGGETLTFTLGTQSCTAVTSPSGAGSCNITINQAPSSTTLTVSFAGDANDNPVSLPVPFTITREETSLAYTGATESNFHVPVTAAGTLTEDGLTPIAGRTVSFVLDGAETCSSTTDATGAASCSITPHEAAGTYSIAASFAGDGFFLPSSTSAPFTVCSVPVFTSVPPTVFIGDCTENPNLGTVTATSNCGATITSNAPSPFPPGATVVTYTATNSAGGTATATQTVIAGEAIVADSGQLFSDAPSLVDSYQSSLGPYGGANVGTLGDVDVAGTVVHNGGTIRGTITQNASIGLPIVPVPAGATNLGSEIENSGTTTLLPGQYVVSTLIINRNATLRLPGTPLSPVTGAAVQIWVTGSIVLGGNENLNGLPENLQIFSTSNQSVNINGTGGALFGVIYAPDAPINVDQSSVFGSIVGSTVTLNSGAAVHFDSTPVACSTFQ